MIKYIPNSFVGMNRKEKNGNYFCIPAATQFPIFVNPTVHQIYTMCNDKTTEEVIKEFSEIHPDVPLEKITSDVKNTLWYLYNIKLITIPDKFEESDNPNINASDELAILNEEDFYLTSNFVSKCIKDDSKESVCMANMEVRNFPNEIIEKYYDVAKTRMNHVMGTEVYYKFTEAEATDISAIIGISIHKFQRVAYIETIFSNDVTLFEKAITLMGNYLGTTRIENLKFALTDSTVDKNIMSILLKNGFKYEATLVSEGKQGDLSILSQSLVEGC